MALLPGAPGAELDKGNAEKFLVKRRCIRSDGSLRWGIWEPFDVVKAEQDAKRAFEAGSSIRPGQPAKPTSPVDQKCNVECHDEVVAGLYSDWGLTMTSHTKPIIFQFDDVPTREDGLGSWNETTTYTGSVEGAKKVFKPLKVREGLDNSAAEVGLKSLNSLAVRAFDDLLGFGVTVSVRLAIAFLDNRWHLGTLSDFADGNFPEDELLEELDPSGQYRAPLIDKLHALQLLDHLAGVDDHLTDNYHVSIVDGKVSVKAFDNESSFDSDEAAGDPARWIRLVPIVKRSRADAVCRIRAAQIDAILQIFEALKEDPDRVGRRQRLYFRLQSIKKHLAVVGEKCPVVPDNLWKDAVATRLGLVSNTNSYWGILRYGDPRVVGPRSAQPGASASSSPPIAGVTRAC